MVLTVLGQTTTTLSALTNGGASDSSLFGQSVTFTATVTADAPASGTPIGTVIFEDGSTILGTVPLSQGSASLNTSTLGVGMHTITAEFHGDRRLAEQRRFADADGEPGPHDDHHRNFAWHAGVRSVGNLHGHRQPDRDGVGTPTGTVAFYVDGAQVGTSAIEVVHGVSTAIFQDAAALRGLAQNRGGLQRRSDVRGGNPGLLQPDRQPIDINGRRFARRSSESAASSADASAIDSSHPDPDSTGRTRRSSFSSAKRSTQRRL